MELPEGATGRELLSALSQRYPKVASLAPSLKLAVNQEYVPWDYTLSRRLTRSPSSPRSRAALPGDFQPFIEVTTQPLSADRYQQLVLSPTCGAVALFVGVVREFTGDKRTVFP